MAGWIARIAVAGTLITSPAAQAAVNDGDAACPAAALPAHIRTTSCDMMRAIGIGLSESPSLRRLVERIAVLHGIVYVTARQVVQVQTRRVIDGTLQHRVTVAGSYRLLYVTVTPYSGTRAVPVIAHELQHAIEVLESEATSERAIDALFDRIGVRTAARTVETAAALAVQRDVANELQPK
jgi:hypothetical protein